MSSEIDLVISLDWAGVSDFSGIVSGGCDSEEALAEGTEEVLSGEVDNEAPSIAKEGI